MLNIKFRANACPDKGAAAPLNLPLAGGISDGETRNPVPKFARIYVIAFTNIYTQIQKDGKNMDFAN